MTEEEIRPIAENYVEEFCHDIHGGYEDGDLVCAGIGTALIVARKLEKQNKELQKQIEKMKHYLNEFMRISVASVEEFEPEFSELVGEVETFLEK